jgi:hypothetical protein
MTKEGMTLFRSLYKNYDGLQDKLINYWAKVAQSLSKNKYVVGFDPLNEPWPSWSGVTDAINTLLPGRFDQNDLAPMYTKIYEKLK